MRVWSSDEKARLDNFAIALQNEPGSRGAIVGYGSCDEEGQKRAQRAKDYLVNTYTVANTTGDPRRPMARTTL